MASSVPFTLEGAHQGLPNEPILYRIRVPAHGPENSHQGPVIRYLTAPHPPKGASGMPDYRGDLLTFDTVPAGDWNLGRLVATGGSVEGKFILGSTETAQLEETSGLLDAGPAWIDKAFNLVDLLDAYHKGDQADDSQDDIAHMPTDIQCMNHVSAMVLPTPGSLATTMVEPEVIGVWAWQPGHAHGIANESHIYSIIQARDPGIAPRFLAHITDNDTRVIGFLLQRVMGACEAGTTDLEKCRNVLSRLHALGIAYGGLLKRHSFLICDGNDTVLLQGFGGSFMTTDQEVFSCELNSLEQLLA